MEPSLSKKQCLSLERQYAAAKKQMLNIGFIAEGSLSKNYVTCGKATCRCRNNREDRHGPYYQLTWKRNAKTVSQAIPKSLALQYEEWIRNRQELASIMRKMYTISQKAIEKHLAGKNDPEEKIVVLSVKNKLGKT
jgi:hypothetical protein